MGDISAIPAEIMHNIIVRLPIKLSIRLKCVCKHWNRVISDPYLIKSWTGDRKILLPFEIPIDDLEENDTIRSMVTLSSSSFSNPGLEGKDVAFVGSCNGIVLLVIQDFHNYIDHMVLYNPLTRATSKPIPVDLHSLCNNKNHVYGFGYGSSTPDDVKIVRFRGCEFSSSRTNKNWHTCDVFSLKTNSWIVLENFIQNAHYLNNVGTFANGSLYWIANSNDNAQLCIVALDVNKMKLSYINVPDRRTTDDLRSLFRGVTGFLNITTWVRLGTLHGCLCIVGYTTWTTRSFTVSVLRKTTDDGVEKYSWLKVSEFELRLKSEFQYNDRISILDNGIILISMSSFQEIVIYDIGSRSINKVINNISARPSYFQRSHCGIEYVESLVSPSN